ncbi:MAG: molybdate ABC transporter substrate-binding protein [Pseudomonadota bacterium]
MTGVVATLAALATSFAASFAAIPAGAGERPTVFAAASLKNALDAAAAAHAARGQPAPRIAYAATSTLARQVVAGAPADLLVTASTDWMDHVEAAGRLVPGSRRDLMGNRLVLVAPASPSAARDPAPAAAGGAEGGEGPALAATIGTRLGDGRLAVALTGAVPAGQYARAALETLGLWPALRDRLAETDNVRTALALVARGEAPLGIVYATNARAEPRVTTLATLPAASHPPIVYPAALVAAPRAGSAAAAFLAFLAGAEGQAILADHGFLPLPPAAARTAAPGATAAAPGGG